MCVKVLFLIVNCSLSVFAASESEQQEQLQLHLQQEELIPDLVITIEQESQEEEIFDDHASQTPSTLEELGEIDVPFYDDLVPSIIFNPIRFITALFYSKIPEKSIMRRAAVRTGVPMTLSLTSKLIPGGFLVFGVIQFYAPTEEDFINGEGSLARLVGDKMRRTVVKLPNGEHIITYFDEKIKPEGANTFTEALMNAVVGDIARTRIDQGGKVFAKSLSQNIIKQFLPFGAGHGIIASYQYIKNKIAEHKEAKRLAAEPMILDGL